MLEKNINTRSSQFFFSYLQSHKQEQMEISERNAETLLQVEFQQLFNKFVT